MPAQIDSKLLSWTLTGSFYGFRQRKDWDAQWFHFGRRMKRAKQHPIHTYNTQYTGSSI
jgi:hypothetical protein